MLIYGLLACVCVLKEVLGEVEINYLHVNDEKNDIANKALQTVISELQKMSNFNIKFGAANKVTANGTDAQGLIESLCQVYNSSIDENKQPHVIIDTTMSDVSSEVVKYFTKALELPTVSASCGQDGDLRHWRNLKDGQEGYLIQVMPPVDVIPEFIRSYCKQQNISNAGILFDDSYIMDHKYKSLLQNVPTRHIINEIDFKGIGRQLESFNKREVFNYFILGRTETINKVLEEAAEIGNFGRPQFGWYAITQDEDLLSCTKCNESTKILHVLPDTRKKNPESIKPHLTFQFYYDLFSYTFLAIKSIANSQTGWPVMKYMYCEEYIEGEKFPKIRKLNLLSALKTEVDNDAGLENSNIYGKMDISQNGFSHMGFNMTAYRVTFHDGKEKKGDFKAPWPANIGSLIHFKEADEVPATYYTVVVALQKPFVMKYVDENGVTQFKGYCIDLINAIRNLTLFEMQIYEVEDGKFGNMDENGNWNGMIKDLMDKKAHIALGSLSVMAERENVVDFTVPYYDLVGITIMMKKPKTPTSLFKFLTVLENDVWLCILAAYFFTSFLMWVFDRWSPYSYQNNREKYKDDEEKREFNLKECLWFCMTSLTPQGGGEAPKNLSGRLVAATWWLFGFIIIASYTANLAAFLTVSRLDTPVESLDDLSKQYKIQYAPLANSSPHTYFQRMADIENRFYEIWKDMSLNDSLSEVERAKLAVWDYPVSDKYTKILQAMTEAKFPTTMDKALDRVRASKSSSEGFAFIGDATDVRYQVLTNCDLQMVGEEFSRKPYAIAVQQGSPLKDQFNNAILQLLNKRKLEKLKEQWWNQNPERKTDCEKQDDQSDGISIQNIGGVFIVIFVGIGLACITLAFEYWWYKLKPQRIVVDVPSATQQPTSKAEVASLRHGFQPRNFGQTFGRRQGVSLPGVTNPW